MVERGARAADTLVSLVRAGAAEITAALGG